MSIPGVPSSYPSEESVRKFARAMKRADDAWKRLQWKSPLTKRLLQAQKDRDSNWPGKRRGGY